jgi:hypothetical protein
MAQHLRVKIASGVLAASGATDKDVGQVADPVLAANDLVAVVPANAPGPQFYIAAKAIAVGATVYQAASGKTTDDATGSPTLIGIAITAAQGDGSVYQVQAVR